MVDNTMVESFDLSYLALPQSDFTPLAESPDTCASKYVEAQRQAGVIDEAVLNLEESLVWLVMQAAVEEPNQDIDEWVATALSVTKPEDFLPEFSEQDVYSFCIMQAITAAELEGNFILVSKEERERGEQ